MSSSIPTPPRPLRVCLLGSTGSIGVQTLEVCEQQGSRVEVVGLAAGRNAERLFEQAAACGARDLVLRDETSLEPPTGARLDFGDEAVIDLIDRTEPDIVVNAVVGAAGLLASVRTVERGARLALANKESIVIAGEPLLRLARERGAEVIPVDSEHSALLQCLRSGDRSEVRALTLTASGGPFRGSSRSDLENVTPPEALQHPTWSMGSRISIDSATLMNKGLEVIEAHHLFQVSVDQIDVVVHPQSTVHSMVEFVDGSWLAHLGPPDMRVPIRYALSHPLRWPTTPPPFSLAELGRLEFEEPDHKTFPSLELAYRACRGGGTLPAVLNAADEIAVEAFLAGRIPFLKIFDTVERALSEHTRESTDDWNRLLEIDRETRERVTRWIS